MYIGIITPAPSGSRYGNRVTAVRWAKILRQLGHRVAIRESYLQERFDLIVALHARRSLDSIQHFHSKHPEKPIIVALTGTDLYQDLSRSRDAQRALDIATRLVVLQSRALDELRPDWHEKARVLHQSVSPLNSDHPHRSSRSFDVCVVGHLRPVKDPFRTAKAARLLPAASRIRVIHLGSAMNPREEEAARREMISNRRYRWLGEVSQARVRRVMARSRLFVLSSRVEGGANVLGEAIVTGAAVLASRIPGTIGILGEDYPGYFEVGDTEHLASLMRRCETDSVFLAELKRQCDSVADLFDPAREQAAWADLLTSCSFY